MVEITLQLVKENIFEGFKESEGNLPGWTQFAEQVIECYKIEEAKLEDQEPREVHIPETEGERDIEGMEIIRSYSEPLKNVKVNIGTVEVPKFSSIGDYWDEQTMCKITDLLHEYQHLFPIKFTKMKGIAGDLGEMRIPLKPNAKPV